MRHNPFSNIKKIVGGDISPAPSFSPVAWPVQSENSPLRDASFRPAGLKSPVILGCSARTNTRSHNPGKQPAEQRGGSRRLNNSANGNSTGAAKAITKIVGGVLELGMSAVFLPQALNAQNLPPLGQFAIVGLLAGLAVLGARDIVQGIRRRA